MFMVGEYEKLNNDDLKKMELLVWDALKESQRARNSDTFLILKVMQELGQDISVMKDFNRPKGTQPFTHMVVWRIDLDTVPSFESITRARRKIQAGGQFLPTNPAVCRQRRINEERMREYYAKGSR